MPDTKIIAVLGATGAQGGGLVRVILDDPNGGFGFPGAEDVGNMFQFKRDFEEYYCGARNLGVSRSLNPALQSFSAFLAKNQRRIPLE